MTWDHRSRESFPRSRAVPARLAPTSPPCGRRLLRLGGEATLRSAAELVSDGVGFRNAERTDLKARRPAYRLAEDRAGDDFATDHDIDRLTDDAFRQLAKLGANILRQANLDAGDVKLHRPSCSLDRECPRRIGPDPADRAAWNVDTTLLMNERQRDLGRIERGNSARDAQRDDYKARNQPSPCNRRPRHPVHPRSGKSRSMSRADCTAFSGVRTSPDSPSNTTPSVALA
jgi:hypothetical protein